MLNLPKNVKFTFTPNIVSSRNRSSVKYIYLIELFDNLGVALSVNKTHSFQHNCSGIAGQYCFDIIRCARTRQTLANM